MQTEVGAASPAPGETREKENRETQGSLGSPGGEQSRQSLAPLRILFPWFSSDLEPFGEDWGILRSKITDPHFLEGMDERLVLQQMTLVWCFS